MDSWREGIPHPLRRSEVLCRRPCRCRSVVVAGSSPAPPGTTCSACSDGSWSSRWRPRDPRSATADGCWTAKGASVTRGSARSSAGSPASSSTSPWKAPGCPWWWRPRRPGPDGEHGPGRRGPGTGRPRLARCGLPEMAGVPEPGRVLAVGDVRELACGIRGCRRPAEPAPGNGGIVGPRRVRGQHRVCGQRAGRSSDQGGVVTETLSVDLAEQLVRAAHAAGLSAEDLTLAEARVLGDSAAGRLTVAEYWPAALATIGKNTARAYRSYLRLFERGSGEMCGCDCAECFPVPPAAAGAATRRAGTASPGTAPCRWRGSDSSRWPRPCGGPASAVASGQPCATRDAPHGASR